jgi:hypothetical protein
MHFHMRVAVAGSPHRAAWLQAVCRPSCEFSSGGAVADWAEVLKLKQVIWKWLIRKQTVLAMLFFGEYVSRTAVRPKGQALLHRHCQPDPLLNTINISYRHAMQAVGRALFSLRGACSTAVGRLAGTRALSAAADAEGAAAAREAGGGGGGRLQGRPILHSCFNSVELCLCMLTYFHAIVYSFLP